MADKIIYLGEHLSDLIEPLPIKAHDNGDGTFSLSMCPVAGPQPFDLTFTTAVIKAQNHTANLLVPGITGKVFYPTFAAMCAAGSVTTATTIRLVETSAAGVVLSHVAADMTNGTWVGPTGGTVVTTLLGAALPSGAGIEIVDVAANSLTVTTAIRAVVFGYYV
jgi:hypothetical protein